MAYNFYCCTPEVSYSDARICHSSKCALCILNIIVRTFRATTAVHMAVILRSTSHAFGQKQSGFRRFVQSIQQLFSRDKQQKPVPFGDGLSVLWRSVYCLFGGSDLCLTVDTSARRTTSWPGSLISLPGLHTFTRPCGRHTAEKHARVYKRVVVVVGFYNEGGEWYELQSSWHP